MCGNENSVFINLFQAAVQSISIGVVVEYTGGTKNSGFWNLGKVKVEPFIDQSSRIFMIFTMQPCLQMMVELQSANPMISGRVSWFNAKVLKCTNCEGWQWLLLINCLIFYLMYQLVLKSVILI